MAERTNELQATNLELRKSKEEVQAASLAKTHFLANMSHEIRTPIHGGSHSLTSLLFPTSFTSYTLLISSTTCVILIGGRWSAGILGMTELALSASLAPEQKGQLETVTQSAAHLVRNPPHLATCHHLIRTTSPSPQSALPPSACDSWPS